MSILKRPITTEKSQELIEDNKYTFEVDRNANKITIANAVEKMYGVTVENVTTLTQFGKKKSRMTRNKITTGRTPTYKKAIVTLKEGDTIDFYSEV